MRCFEDARHQYGESEQDSCHQPYFRPLVFVRVPHVKLHTLLVWEMKTVLHRGCAAINRGGLTAQLSGAHSIPAQPARIVYRAGVQQILAE
jgi:hypothetical protein